MEQPSHTEGSGSGGDQITSENEEDLDVVVIGGSENPQSVISGEMETTNKFNCPSLGIHPAPTCDSFYVCTRIGMGGATLQSCGAGLHFDSRLQACNWPVDAKCTHSLAAAKFYTEAM